MRLITQTALMVLFAGSSVRAAFPTLALRPVVLKQIHSPTTITYAPDGSGRLFVCDQLGKIRIIQDGMMLPTPFLDIASPANPSPNNGPGPVIDVGVGYAERGLLGLTFHPGYADSGSPGFRRFYVNYTKAYESGIDPAPPQPGDPINCVTVIAEYQVSATNPNMALPETSRRVLAFTQPQSNHNGGMIEFGPDGLLYIGAGDGGSQDDNNAGHTGGSAARPTNNLGNSQDRTRFLGKILRIDPLDPDGTGPLTYSIPTDNPFYNDATPGLKKEIFAYGLRNPWRFSFDKRAPSGPKRLFCGDVGGGRIEEINIITSGGNYGWRYKEGTELPTFSSGAPTNPMAHPGGTLIDPIAMYAHTGVTTSPPLPQLGLSVTGGYMYRGAAIPDLQGKFVFGDYGSTSTLASWDSPLMGLEETAPLSGVFTLTQTIPLFGTSNPIVGQRILCLGEDEEGEIYIGIKSNAGVLQLDAGYPAGGIYKVVPVVPGSVTLSPSIDNTVFAEDIPLARDRSDALGFLYAGRTGTGTGFGAQVRRSLIAFDVASSIPTGALVTSASLTMTVNRTGPAVTGSTMISLHRMNETWGEGSSINAAGGTGATATSGDATWRYRFYDSTLWTTPGGSFQPTASASIPLVFGTMTWPTSPSLVNDVQTWVNSAASNAGWMVRGDEVTAETAIRFDSKDMGSFAPQLTVNFGAVPPLSRYETWIKGNYPNNLPGEWVNPEGDTDGDGIRNLMEYATGFNPAVKDDGSDFTVTATQLVSGATEVTITFRRDVQATDLVYKLQVSDTLQSWTTIAESDYGAATDVFNGAVLDLEWGIGGPIILATVKLEIPVGSPVKKYVRAVVDKY